MQKDLIYKNSKDEWYTPLSIINYAKKLMGCINLDPATTRENAERMGIYNYFTKKSNGLTKPWIGNVWLNPPFSNKNDWIRKARKELDSGNAKRIFILLPMSFETQIWQECILGRAIIHIPNKRICFIDNGEKRNTTPPFGSCLVELTKTPNNKYKMFKIEESRNNENN